MDLEQLWPKLQEWLAMYGMKLVAALAVLIIGRIIIGILVGIVRKLLKRADVDDTLAKFAISMTKIGLMTFLILIFLGTLGIQTASFIVVLGAAGLAVGFALQGSLANFAAGVMLISFRPFKAGDYVEAGGISGSVEAISIFHTTLKTPDNKKVIVPNGQITSGPIINYSAHDTRRIDLVFGIGYGDDIKKAKELMETILSEDPRVLKDPAPTVAVSELGDSSVNFVCRPWVKTSDYWGALFDITEKVKLTFDQEGVSIPFPQRDVHVYQTSDN